MRSKIIVPRSPIEVVAQELFDRHRFTATPMQSSNQLRSYFSSPDGIKLYLSFCENWQERLTGLTNYVKAIDGFTISTDSVPNVHLQASYDVNGGIPQPIGSPSEFVRARFNTSITSCIKARATPVYSRGRFCVHPKKDELFHDITMRIKSHRGDYQDSFLDSGFITPEYRGLDLTDPLNAAHWMYRVAREAKWCAENPKKR